VSPVLAKESREMSAMERTAKSFFMAIVIPHKRYLRPCRQVGIYQFDYRRGRRCLRPCRQVGIVLC
jgi:hypothetical protein